MSSPRTSPYRDLSSSSSTVDSRGSDSEFKDAETGAEVGQEAAPKHIPHHDESSHVITLNSSDLETLFMISELSENSVEELLAALFIAQINKDHAELLEAKLNPEKQIAHTIVKPIDLVPPSQRGLLSLMSMFGGLGGNVRVAQARRDAANDVKPSNDADLDGLDSFFQRNSM